MLVDKHGWCVACGGTGVGDVEVYPDGEERPYRCEACDGSGGDGTQPCSPLATWSPLHPVNADAAVRGP